MSEGTLYPSSTPGNYAIGSQSGPDIRSEQRVEVLLGGHWVAGEVAHSSSHVVGGMPDPLKRNRGTYAIADDEPEDTVMEASMESFPASDPPAWSTTRHDRSPQHQHPGGIIDGYYFVADDGNICGLCAGMKVRAG